MTGFAKRVPPALALGGLVACFLSVDNFLLLLTLQGRMLSSALNSKPQPPDLKPSTLNPKH